MIIYCDIYGGWNPGILNKWSNYVIKWTLWQDGRLDRLTAYQVTGNFYETTC